MSVVVTTKLTSTRKKLSMLNFQQRNTLSLWPLNHRGPLCPKPRNSLMKFIVATDNPKETAYLAQRLLIASAISRRRDNPKETAYLAQRLLITSAISRRKDNPKETAYLAQRLLIASAL